MWRLVKSILIFLCLFDRTNFLYSQETPLVSKLSCDNRTIPDFWNNLSYLPVQFIITDKKNGTLTGQFASPYVSLFKPIEFKLTPEDKNEMNMFFKIDGEWGKGIDRKTFWKKSKEGFWIVSYLNIGGERIICNAHQFKNWQSLEASYAQGSKNFSVTTIEFWNNLKAKAVYIQEIKDNDILWIFVLNLGNVPSPEYVETIDLSNGEVINKYPRFYNGTTGVVLDYGFFTMDKNCVFHELEKREPKSINIPKVTKKPFILGSLEIRAKPVSREYFIKHAPQEPWLCFYEVNPKNETPVLLRAISEPLYKENNNKNGNGKDQNGKNSKKLR